MAANMATRLTVEKIGLFRRGSDIDIEAVFQGHISGRRLQGVKSNPIYHDQRRKEQNLNNSGHSASDLNITIYNSFPTDQYAKNGSIPASATDQIVKQNEHTFLKRDNSESPDLKSLSGKDMQRESLKVTNGEVLVGDIIIEMGFQSTSLDEEEVVQELEKIAKGEHLDLKDDGEHIKNLNKEEKVALLKEELDNIRVEKLNSANAEHKEVGNGIHISGKSVSEESDWPSIDDLALPKINDKNASLCNGQVKMNGSLPSRKLNGSVPYENGKINGSLPSRKLNGSIPRENGKMNGSLPNNKMVGSLKNQKLNGSFTCEKDKTLMNGHANGQIQNKTQGQSSDANISTDTDMKKSKKSKNEKKSSRKLRERKNSLPDHILNSLSMQPKKPILIPTISDTSSQVNSESHRMNSSIMEQKSVKFSEDTVFNENKPSKYRKEKLRDSHHRNGTVQNLATLNPVFVDDNGFEIGLTDDEKALRYSLHKCDTDSELGNLNVPGYMKEYIITSNDLPPLSTRTPLTRAKIRGAEDIENITDDTEGPHYLMDKTLAKQRRSKVIRLVLACFAFVVVVGVVVLLVVYFGKPRATS